MQKTWRSYIRSVRESCTPEFWDMFGILRLQPAVNINQVLKKVYKLLQQTAVPTGHRWPTSVRSLMSRIKMKAGWFWDHVTHERTINLRAFGFSDIKFTFVDPVFVWIRQAGANLHVVFQTFVCVFKLLFVFSNRRLCVQTFICVLNYVTRTLFTSKPHLCFQKTCICVLIPAYADADA